MSGRARVAGAIVIAALVVLGACSQDDDSSGVSTTTTTTVDVSTTTSSTTPSVDLDAVGLGATRIAELEEPLALAYQSGSPSLFVAERAGRVRKITVTVDPEDESLSYELERQPVLDIGSQVRVGGEQGLLGLTFSPDGRRMYVSYNEAESGASMLDEYTMDEQRPDVVDTDTLRTIMRVDQPDFGNHKGGDVHFGPDGFLYWGLGDGGSQGDPDGNGQNPEVPLAKLLRVDPEGGDDQRPYGIPDGNPFADGAQGLPEVFLFGVRNPWRFSFDDETGDLWIGDVGGSEFEEVNVLRADAGGGAGANLGWDVMEGSSGTDPGGAVLPLLSYDHSGGGCAITGGYVYRGTRIPDLTGAYLYADYCVPGIRGLRASGGEVTDERAWGVDVGEPVSFGEDGDGNLYVLSISGGVYRLDPG